MSLYRGMNQAELDTAYNNQAAVHSFAQVVARWRERSAHVVRASGARLDIAYGNRPRQVFDYFPAKRIAAPLLVFIHGGYWQGGEKRSVGFLAEGPLTLGFAVAVIEYTVAPEGRMAGMVEEVRSSLAWLREHADELGFDSARIVLAGHSAGAQLLCNVPHDGVIGAIAISGLFDLEPIRLSYLNAKLQLTKQDVARYSPMQHANAQRAPLCVAVGAKELPELVRQSDEFARACNVPLLPLAGHDHFSILDELASPDGALCKRLGRFAGR